MNVPDINDDPEDTEHTPAERAAAASRSTWVSVGVNLVLTITQIVVGVVAKSQGLIADGIHSLSDLVADFVVLFASHHAQKDADEDHPYGHQRFETGASMVLGLLLLAVGVGMHTAARCRDRLSIAGFSLDEFHAASDGPDRDPRRGVRMRLRPPPRPRVRPG